ncbi:hypothetical protein BDZ45DRAFT_796797 [Acephala macrosclerotiorum]|nr:hypothetical protein BDZ45DRAFT_796797 [Acephala macrosclerotiorum]
MASEKDKLQRDKSGVKVTEGLRELSRPKNTKSQVKLEEKMENRRATTLKPREAVQKGEKMSRRAKKKATRKAAAEAENARGTAMEE